MSCHAIFPHQSSFLPQTLLLKYEVCQQPVPPQHRRHANIRQSDTPNVHKLALQHREMRRQQILH